MAGRPVTNQEEANRHLEEATAAKSTFKLRVDLGLLATLLTAADARGRTATEKRRLVRDATLRINPSVGALIVEGILRGVELGHEHVGVAGPVLEIRDTTLEDLVESTNRRVFDRLLEAIGLSEALPMLTADDTTAVVAKARSALMLAETDASWAVHRAVAVGVSEAAAAEGQNVVWVAERNACLNCLAYQGRVVAPGQAFPSGLTYGDRPVEPYGTLIGPPLHPHCRCELETSDLEAGTIDEGLAREAARSVARGLTDHASEAGRLRAVDRLVKGQTGLPVPALPKSVLERARRNLDGKEFKARPGSAAAKAQIAARAAGRERRGQPEPERSTVVSVVRVPPTPVTGRIAAERLKGPILPSGPDRSALLRYTGGEYGMVNGRLRRREKLPEDLQEVVDALDRLAIPAPMAMVVHRGISGDASFIPGKGESFTDPAPLSTSLDISKARQLGGDVQLRILIPEGTPIIPVSQLQRGEKYEWGQAGSEEEILLPPGTRLVVVSESVKDGTRIVTLRVQ